MDVQYYLQETAVQRGYFKQFSSRCHIWIKMLDKYKEVFETSEDTLKLVYLPAQNVVRAYYEETNALLARIDAEASRMNHIRSEPLRATRKSLPEHLKV
jgi:hypothetical protein